MEALIPVLVIIVGLVFAIYGRTRFESKSSWQNFYDGFSFSAIDFYGQVKAGLEERKIPNISIAKESFLESHILSDKREYLRITRAEYTFFICTAPFGTGTFVSEWTCIKHEHSFDRMPIISKLIGRDRRNKTFYQMDTESMTRMAIHSTVLDVLDSLTTASGIRGLTELEAKR